MSEPTKLRDLSPHWISLSGWASADPFYVGISFLCPHCIHGPCPTCGQSRGKRLAVNFWPPIDPAGLLGRMFDLPDNGAHRRSGDSFDNLTLEPSIGFESIGHWHGRITNGSIVS
jgi:hypothetical protein